MQRQPVLVQQRSADLFLAFKTGNGGRDAKIFVTIEDWRDVPVFRFEHRNPSDGGLIFMEVVVGALDPGVHRVTVKVKQDDKSVGQRYWLIIYPPPGS
jgi:hypothetical protein